MLRPSRVCHRILPVSGSTASADRWWLDPALPPTPEAPAEVAALFGIGEATLRRWVRRDRETGSVAPIVDYPRGPAPKIEHANLEVLEELMRETPDATHLPVLLFRTEVLVHHADAA